MLKSAARYATKLRNLRNHNSGRKVIVSIMRLLCVYLIITSCAIVPATCGPVGGGIQNDIFAAIRSGSPALALAIAQASPTILDASAPTGDHRLRRARPVRYAILCGEDKLAIALMRIEGHPDIEFYLHDAIFHDRYAVVMHLLDTGAPMELGDRTEFLARNLLSVHALGNPKSLRVAKLLVKRGAGISTPEHNGATPVVYACLSNNHDLARFLIERGARPARDPEMQRANDLVLAVVSSPGEGDVEMLKYLREKGLFPNGSEKYWEKMQRIAARHPDTGVSKYLRQVHKEHTKRDSE